MATKIRELQTGKDFHVEGNTARDVNGKIIGRREGGDDVAMTLSEQAARLMADLGPGDVTAATASRATFTTLPDVDFIADAVAPIRMVKHDRGTWWIEKPSDATQAPLTLVVQAGAAPARVSPSFVNTAFVCTGYGAAVEIPDIVARSADFDAAMVSLQRITFALRLGREQRVASLLTTSSNWASNNVVAATAKWNGGTTANPLIDMFSARAKSLIPPNTLVLSEAAEPYFFWNANSTAVRDFVQAGGVLPRVRVGRARYGLGPAYVWSPSTPSNAVLIRESADPNELATATTLRWTGDAPDGQVKDGVLVRQFKMTGSGFPNHVVVVVHNDAELLLQSGGSTVGALITGVLQ